MAPQPAGQSTTSAKARFGAFAGVFTPNVLTILGIIFFLRTGWVVGQTGLIGALIIVGIANLISFLTGLSLSSVSTSMDVKVGGLYYIISRSLGLEIGGAIGIPLYLSQAISVAFYIIGFTEAFVSTFPILDPQLISTILVFLFGILAYLGADFILRIQYGILALLGLAIVSLFSGSWGQTVTPDLFATMETTVSFWEAFAVFFPAVTGIAIGASMSGDLKEPSVDIPKGTLWSIGVTTVVYLGATVWLAFHATGTDLRSNNLIMEEIARWPIFILLGVWAATLSSALGSILAAPRTLQAIAYDDVVPGLFGSQLGSKTEPRVAVIATTIIALAVVWMGNLNFVAPIISMFFLNTYGMINLTAGIERLTGNPSFRPQIRIPWPISILGALGCYGAMFLINWVATIIAIVVSFGIFFYLARKAVQRTWGDVWNGWWFTLSRYALLNLKSRAWHVKNWRPNLLVFTGQPYNREQLVDVSEWLSMGKGIVTFTQLIIGDIHELADRGMRDTAKKHIRKYIRRYRMTAFAEAELVNDFRQGVLTVAQSHGIAGLEPNTIFMGWSRDPSGREREMHLLRDLYELHKSVLFLHFDRDSLFGNHKQIDVWWRGRSRNAELMLLLAHLISRHRFWYQAKIRLLQIVDQEKGREQAQTHIQEMLRSVRVHAKPEVLVKSSPDQRISSMIRERQSDADLTLLGMKVPREEEIQGYSEYLNELVEAIGTVLLVRSAQEEDVLGTI